ncbi:hypothetical protein KUV85_12500 [Nocardioides panacisoli]|uniref:hypothetical protein n=1 Tax=Nocardioides panacisoli TaxID=627624 RepID=UPI001C62BFA0|nr:hypothetical protein [Nocardioides panacisoli]QYJ03152.1 hypothetical protein KUV85_12500 [Nocardioides panacisoli]
MAEQDAARPAGDPSIKSAVAATFSQAQVARALRPAEAGVSGLERAAVEREIGYQALTHAKHVGRRDLRVGTVTDGDLQAVVVVPDSNVKVQSVTVGAGGSSGLGEKSPREIVASVEMADDPARVPASQSGPGMGSWPRWDNSFHSSVRLRVYFRGNYLGDGVFQTYRRKMKGETKPVDYWQISRHAVGRPRTSDGWGSPRIKKLWVSQNLTDGAHKWAREWLWKRTKPKQGWSSCRDGVGISVGPFTFTPRECSEYDVWTGRIGHQRISFDQGRLVRKGQYHAAYVSGFTMRDGHFPNMTWYEFVTIQEGYDQNYFIWKCRSKERGPQNKTATRDCRFTRDEWGGQVSKWAS